METLRKNVKAVTLCAAMCLFSFGPLFAQMSNDLSDAEIASVAVVANQNDIDFAKIALERSENPKVRNFAEAMARDHQQIIDMAVALVTKLKVTPKNNAVSKQLLANAKKTKEMLRSKSDKEFDKAYVDNEVAYHKAVIGAIQTVLIPQSQNKELKQLLETAMPLLNSHLHHAVMLQNELNKG